MEIWNSEEEVLVIVCFCGNRGVNLGFVNLEWFGKFFKFIREIIEELYFKNKDWFLGLKLFDLG